jgi:deferrochelatase/peroxidase EfeB
LANDSRRGLDWITQSPVLRTRPREVCIEEEDMNDYVQPVGGGYFYTLPGVRAGGDWYGRALLA